MQGRDPDATQTPASDECRPSDRREFAVLLLGKGDAAVTARGRSMWVRDRRPGGRLTSAHRDGAAHCRTALNAPAFSSDTETVRHTATDGEPALLLLQLAEVFDAARPTRIKAGCVRIDHRKVDHLVAAINRATGSRIRRDWRGRVTVSATSRLAVAANDAREATAHARAVPLTDDVLLRHERAEQIATALRQATA